MNRTNMFIMDAHWRASENMRADEEYLAMAITCTCADCGKDLSKLDPNTLHPSFDYETFLCDDCYYRRMDR